MIDGKLLIEKLIIYAKQHLYLSEYDVVYKRNALLNIFKLDMPMRENIKADVIHNVEIMNVPDTLINDMVAFFEQEGVCEGNETIRLAVSVMGILSPLPSEINNKFKKMREQFGSVVSCNYLYGLCIKNNSVKKSALAQNIIWSYSSGSNRIDLTINISKPEKDNKDVAKLINAVQKTDKYPPCAICKENQGFYGNNYIEPRGNLRMVGIELSNENWFMQYSPYGYLEEHCILINEKHTPMHMHADIIDKLFDFIEYLPNYFIGTNSDLPIIGGSILTHEHFQGGKKTLPLFNSKPSIEFNHDQYPDVDICLTDWYCGNIRISGFNRNTVKEVFALITNGWLKYSDPAININNNIDKVRNNSQTVIVEFLSDGRYCANVILRNNSADVFFPEGIFHVPPKYFNIKKEALGLMEISGLFILPARLKCEIGEIVTVLTDKLGYSLQNYSDSDNKLYPHRHIIQEIVENEGLFKDEKKAETAVREYISNACIQMLENASVFKRDAEGIYNLKKFLAKQGIK